MSMAKDKRIKLHFRVAALDSIHGNFELSINPVSAEQTAR